MTGRAAGRPGPAVTPAAPFGDDGVRLLDGAYWLRGDGVARRMLEDGQPVASFGSGVRPGALCRLLQPLLLLELHADGRIVPPWLFDAGLERLAGGLDGLSAAQRRGVAVRLRPVLDWIAGDRLADGQPEPVASFLSLPAGLRRTLRRIADDAHDAETAGIGRRPEAEPDRADPPPAPPPDGFTLGLEVDGPAGPAALSIGRTGLVVRQGERPVALEPGWTGSRICTLLFPTLLLELEGGNGEAAVWYLDHRGQALGHSARGLPGPARTVLADALHPLFRAMDQAMLEAPAPVPTPALARFFGLARAVRLDLLELMLESRPAAGLPDRSVRWTLSEPTPPTTGHVVRTRTGCHVLDPAALRAACRQPLHESFAAVMTGGETSWPSPIDGLPVRTALRPLVIDNLCFAYQLYDERHGLAFHVVALEWHFRTFGIYVPSLDLMIAADAAATERIGQHSLDFRGLLRRHLATHGDAIMRGAARMAERGGVPGPLLLVFRGEPSLHVGHYVWQDLTGLDWLLRHVAADRLPHCVVFDHAQGAEMYGQIDGIHPALAGRVIRRDGGFKAGIAAFYEAQARPMKITGIHVRRSVGVQVLDAIDHDPAWRALREAADAVPPGTPVVLIGLRAGNRAPEDQAGLVCRLIAALAAPGRPPPVIVLDGYNQAGDGVTYRSVGDDRPGATSPLDAERAVAGAVAEACRTLGVRLVDTVGQPIAASLIWCRRAQFFVAPWGAALAKYRWICNRPGVVFTGRWNLANRRDLEIYSSPSYMEAPSELRFLPAEHVIDRPGETPERADFHVDDAALAALALRFAGIYPG